MVPLCILSLELFHGENDGVGVGTVTLGELGVLNPSVCLTIELNVAMDWILSIVVLHGLLALSFLSGDRFVGFVARCKFLANLLGRSIVVFLEPWVGNDIRD